MTALADACAEAIRRQERQILLWFSIPPVRPVRRPEPVPAVFAHSHVQQFGHACPTDCLYRLWAQAMYGISP